LPADGDDIDAPVLIEVLRRQIFDSHAAIFDDVPGSLGPLGIERLVDTDAAPLPWFVSLVVNPIGRD